MSGYVPFAGIDAGRRRCESCGAYLSRYNDEPLCAPCATTARRVASVTDIDQLVAGLLLTHDALRPGEPVNLARDLAAYGVEADAETIKLAVRRAGRRHGVVARGEKLKPGYRLVEWQTRYQRVVGFGGAECQRDPCSGRYLRSLPQPEEAAEPEGAQLLLLGPHQGDASA